LTPEKNAIADPVAPDRLAQNSVPCACSHRFRNFQLAQGTGQTRHVTAFVDDPAVVNFAHLVDRITELKAAILGMDRGVDVVLVATVDVNVAVHGESLLAAMLPGRQVRNSSD
jgi:hypothetical protein